MEGKNLPVKHCIRGEVGRGWDIIDEIYEPFCGKIHQWLCKDTFGYLYWEDSLSSEIIGGLVSGKIEEIEIIGLCTDVCVVSNALILKSCFSETRIVVDASCCTGVTEEGHKAALLTMKSCQIQIINE
jgi:nicotinamidase-related amidase